MPLTDEQIAQIRAINPNGLNPFDPTQANSFNAADPNALPTITTTPPVAPTPTANPFDLRAPPSTNSFEDLSNPYYNPNATQDQQKATDALKSPEPPPMDSSKDVKGAEPFVKTGGSTVKMGSESKPTTTGGGPVGPSDRMQAVTATEEAERPVQESLQAQQRNLEDTHKLVFGYEEPVPGTKRIENGQIIQDTKHVPGLNEQIADRQQKEAEAQALWASEYQGMQAQSRMEQDKRDAKLAADRAEVGNMKIDPSRFYSKIGTLGVIAAAIAQGAGAFGAAITHTPNFAMEIINGAVNRDVDAQKEEIQTKWKNVELEGDEAKQKYIRAQGERRDLLEAEMMRRTGVQIEINSLRGQISDRDAMARLDAMSTQNQAELAKSREGLIQMRLQAKLKDRAEAQAAAGTNPLSSLQLQKDYHAYVEDTRKANNAHPDKPVKILSYAEWLPGQSGAGAAAPVAAGGSGADFNTGLDRTLKQYDDIGKVETVNGQEVESNNNPTWSINPYGKDAAAIRKRDQLNSDIIASIHQLSPGLRSPELVEQTTAPFLIKPTDDGKIIAQKKQAFKDYMISHHERTDKKIAPDTGE